MKMPTILTTLAQSRFLNTPIKKLAVGIGATTITAAFGAVVKNGLLHQYEGAGFKFGLKLAVSDLTDYLMLKPLINVATKLFASKEFNEIKVVSFNISCVRNILVALADGRMAETSKLTAAGAKAALKEQGDLLPYRNHYEQKSLETMLTLIHTFAPEIIMMQGVQGKNTQDRHEHQPLLDLLLQKGYRWIQSEGDPFIAVREDSFAPAIKGSTVKMPTHPAIYADLTHVKSGLKIRAVSDHLPAYCPDEENSSLETGDQALRLNVDTVLKDLPKDTTVIYGVDSNTTPFFNVGEADEQLHPDRLEILSNRGFVRDTGSKGKEEATTVDPNKRSSQKRPKRRYDHLLAYNAQRTLNVTRHIIPKLNGEWLLNTKYLFQRTMSDHLPVLATVRISKKPLS